ncbi:sensor histidine kinase [Geomesophilobacter sediminis]|uniref:histidine kinase n=1 Tax=Geomesophilobacter sediminis TaxID=2798584 RepID=A0A8J7JBR5_9BACT|nr:ATP-binding protein [Geomesophilobacter sediminis]MBJ6724641.1 PAS domain S-box protein [Geomesophilobacter sediminis]
MTKDGSSKDDRWSELVHEKETLAQQVKRLIRAEGLLYNYQEKLDDQLREYQDLYDLSKKILGTNQLQTILEHAVEYATARLQYERAVFFTRCELSGNFVACALEGFYNEAERAEVRSTVIAHDAPLLACFIQEGERLLQDKDLLVCQEGACSDLLKSYRSVLHFEEFLLYALGPPSAPLALLIVGNSQADPSFYRAVSAAPDSLIGLGNFVSLISSHVENTILQVEVERIRQLEMLAERKYRDIFENSVDGIFRRTPQGRYLDANPGLARMLGYDSPEALLGEVYRVADLYVRPSRHDELVEQIERQGFVSAFDAELYRKDKSVIWVSISARAARDEKGNISFYEGVIEDISERKRAEEALRRSEQRYRQLTETLEQRVGETVEELREKDRMLILQSRLALMGELLNNVAHQWRQPLNMLALLVQEVPVIFRRGSCDEAYIDGTTRKEMDIIDYMSRTIDDFRHFFTPDTIKTTFNVLENIQHTLSLLEGMLKACHIEIVVKGDVGAEVCGYPNQFSQVMINLLNNARDAFERREIDARRIEIGLERSAGNVVIRVADNAGGIPEAIVDKIFQPYFTTKGPEQGTGIGLFMSKTIIEKHMQGVLEVRNRKGGAEFIITL